MTEVPRELRQKFVGLECRLSPENLHCDGEISRTQAKKRAAQIRREWRELEKVVGRRVTHEEVDKWW